MGSCRKLKTLEAQPSCKIHTRKFKTHWISSWHAYAWTLQNPQSVPVSWKYRLNSFKSHRDTLDHISNQSFLFFIYKSSYIHINKMFRNHILTHILNFLTVSNQETVSLPSSSNIGLVVMSKVAATEVSFGSLAIVDITRSDPILMAFEWNRSSLSELTRIIGFKW